MEIRGILIQATAILTLLLNRNNPHAMVLATDVRHWAHAGQSFSIIRKEDHAIWREQADQAMMGYNRSAWEAIFGGSTFR